MSLKTNSLTSLLSICNQIYFWDHDLYQFSMSIVSLSICFFSLIAFPSIYLTMQIINGLSKKKKKIFLKFIGVDKYEQEVSARLFFLSGKVCSILSI